ncbi:hypothetical protein ABE67_07725 [Cytobacillus firmus]|nr:hypothetical protein [Cytobacillus firmus]
MVQLTISGGKAPPLIEVSLYRSLTGSKPPLWDSAESEEDKWGQTARKGPIGSTNNQRGKSPPTD